MPGAGAVTTIDRRAIDWPRTGRAVYRIRHHYRYTYTGRVTGVRQRLVMVPPDRHADQRLLAYDLDVRGAEGEWRVVWEPDRYGNRVCLVDVPAVPHAVDFEATYRVERRAAAGEPPDAARPEAFLAPTALTAPDDRLRDVARSLAAGGGRPRALAERVLEWAAGAIVYEQGVTGVRTPAAMALHLGRGVCQDFAHVALCVLRLVGVPARYVSGHLLGEGAPHAWVEALLPDPGRPGGAAPLAYDPTHGRRPGLDYVTVAVGRDYADIAPTSGVFSGAATGRLSFSKQADVVEIDYREGPGAGAEAPR